MSAQGAKGLVLRKLRDFVRMLDDLDEEEEAPKTRVRRPPMAVELPQSLEPPPPAAMEPASVFVCDTDAAHAASLATILTASGTTAETFSDTESFVRGLLTRQPAMVFLEVCGKGDSAIDALFAMNDRNYRGGIQLMGTELSPVVDLVRHMGQRHALQVLPALRKPLDVETVRRSLQTQDLRLAPPIAVRLGEAMSAGSVDFWYQPKIDLRRRQIAGVEVFARICHPELGVLHPSMFMQDASPLDLMRLGQMAIKASLATARNFSAVGIHLKVAVNIPVRALFEVPIAEMVRESGLRHARWPGLVLDVTVGQLAEDFQLVASIAPELAANKVQLAIDDFNGTTLSVAKLRELPLAELKLDRSFVSACDHDPARAKVCASVVKLAHHLGCTSVAVGIERQGEMRALLELGCDVGQGYLFGQPMPEQELAAILMKRALAANPEKPAAPKRDRSAELKRAVWR